MRPVVGLVAIGTCCRAVFLVLVRPGTTPDSASYARLADQMRAFDFTAYSGDRTPGYPALLAVSTDNVWAVAIVQAILGIAASVLLYVAVRRLTRRDDVAFAAGLVVAVAGPVLLYEGWLMTEALSLFLVTVLLAGMTWMWGHATSRSAAVVAVAYGWLVLTRPSYALFAPLVAVPAYAAWRHGRSPAARARERRRGLAVAATLLVVGPAAALAISLFNQAKIDYFGPSTIAGFALTNVVCDFADERPADSTATRVYLEERAAHIERTGGCANAIYPAVTAIERRTGSSRADLSVEFARMARELIADHPVPYLSGVARSWPRNWGGTAPTIDDRIRGDGIVASAVVAYVRGSRLVLVAVDAAFLVACLVGLVAFVTRGARVPSPVVLAAGLPLFGSVVHAALDGTDLGRYMLPMLPAILVVVAYTAGRMLDRRAAGQPG